VLVTNAPRLQVMAEGLVVLVGGGEFGPRAHFEVEIASSYGGRVLVVPTAAAFERPERALATARRAFEPHGIEVVELPLYERAQAFQQSIVREINQASCIYVIGGSPFHLRAVLKHSPVFDALVEARARGGALLASSAGAMVLTDPMVDPRGGALTVGLGLVQRLAVIPHADTWPNDLRARTAQLAPPEVLVAELPEQTALAVHRDGTLASYGTVRLSRNQREVDAADVRVSLLEANTAPSSGD
jgi:cyanophycinase